MYNDNEYKFIAVLNRRIEPARLFNAFGHAMAGLANRIEPAHLDLLEYRDADGSPHLGISRFPVIVLAADNANQIRMLRQRLIANNLPFSDFVHTMLGISAEDQLAKTRATREAELEYFVLCTFGATATLAPLTKKFSVYRLPLVAPAAGITQTEAVA